MEVVVQCSITIREPLDRSLPFMNNAQFKTQRTYGMITAGKAYSWPLA